MASVTYDGSLRMNLNDYRGLSAYEIAVKNGFEGSEQAWLASLKGPPGESADNITVNRKRPIDGNISVTGADINLNPGSPKTVSNAIEEIANGQNNGLTTDAIVNDLTTGGTNKVLSAEMGKKLSNDMPRVFWVSVQIPTIGWNTSSKTVDITVDGVLANSGLCAIQYSPDVDSETAFVESGLRVIAQKADALTLRAAKIPSSMITMNVYVTLLKE